MIHHRTNIASVKLRGHRRVWSITALLGAAIAGVVLVSALLASPAGASQFDDLGTNDPQDVEGVEEAPWRAWETSTIGDARAGTAIAIGPDEGAYIGAEHSGRVKLAYPSEGLLPASGFEVSRVDVNGSGDIGGVAVAEDGRVWVTYNTDGTLDGRQEVYVATTLAPSDGEWTRWRLHDYAALPRVAIDADGVVHVIYQADDLRHATYTPEGGWSDQAFATVEPSGTGDIEVALAADRLHVVWKENLFDNPDPEPGYAVRDLSASQGWTLDEVPDEPWACLGEPGVGAAPDGSAWMVCRGDGGVTAWHRSVDGEWSLEKVSDGSNLFPSRQQRGLGERAAVAVDGSGVPHVIFHTDPPFGFENSPTRPGQPQYAARIDGDWSVETIDRNGQWNGKYPSIAVSDEGRPQVGYVLYSQLDPDPWHPCPGCDEVNEDFKLRHAEPLVGALTGPLP